MNPIRHRLVVMLGACALSACAATAQQKTDAQADHAEHVATNAPAATLAQWARGAQHLDGLGDYSRKITTSSPEAQAYFDQGLRLIYGFNHDEAVRSFAKAVELDASCAMCYWGAAEALGPNYNALVAAVWQQAAWGAV